MTKLLVCTQTDQEAHSISQRFPDRDQVVARPWRSITGHRGDVVLIYPLADHHSPGEREVFERWLRESAPTKIRGLGGPIIMGELL